MYNTHKTSLCIALIASIFTNSFQAAAKKVSQGSSTAAALIAEKPKASAVAKTIYDDISKKTLKKFRESQKGKAKDDTLFDNLSYIQEQLETERDVAKNMFELASQLVIEQFKAMSPEEASAQLARLRTELDPEDMATLYSDPLMGSLGTKLAALQKEKLERKQASSGEAAKKPAAPSAPAKKT